MIIGVTGGIGSGKSTVTRMLADHGALVIDADAIGRQIVERPDVLAAISQAFPGTVQDGVLDRKTLARQAFSSPDQTAALDAITGPPIAQQLRLELADAEATGHLVVADVPLLIEHGWHDAVDVVVVVGTNEETRIRRLEARGIDRNDAVARITRQATDEQRRAIADYWIDNNGDTYQLHAEVEELLIWLSEKRRDRNPSGPSYS